MLDAGGEFWQSVNPKHEQYELIIDVEIGATAYRACEVLAAAGFIFGWHPNEHPLNRDNWPKDLPGMPGT